MFPNEDLFRLFLFLGFCFSLILFSVLACCTFRTENKFLRFFRKYFSFLIVKDKSVCFNPDDHNDSSGPSY